MKKNQTSCLSEVKHYLSKKLKTNNSTQLIREKKWSFRVGVCINEGISNANTLCVQTLLGKGNYKPVAGLNGILIDDDDANMWLNDATTQVRLAQMLIDINK